MVKHIGTEAGQANAEHDDGGVRVDAVRDTQHHYDNAEHQAGCDEQDVKHLLRRLFASVFVVVDGAAALAAALVDFFAIWPPLFSGTIVAQYREKWANKLLLGS